MPDALARLGVQRDETVGEQIIADSISPIEIKRRRTRGNIDNSSLRIDGHPSPVIRGAAGLPRVLRPGVFAEVAGMRNGMKRPARFPATHVIGPHIARRSRQGLGLA